jgi:hypothetical protein
MVMLAFPLALLSVAAILAAGLVAAAPKRAESPVAFTVAALLLCALAGFSAMAALSILF